MSGSVSVKLSKPVQAHGQAVDTLTLRPGTGEDLILCGYPLVTGPGGRQVVDTQAVTELAATLAGVPTSTIRALNFSDWTQVFVAVVGFMGPGPTVPAVVPVPATPAA